MKFASYSMIAGALAFALVNTVAAVAADTMTIDKGNPEQKPGQVKPIETKPGQMKPGQVKPIETKPGQAKPVQQKPGQSKPGQVKPAVKFL